MRNFTYSIFGIITLLLFSCSEKKVKQIPLIEGLVSNYAHQQIYLFNESDTSNALDTISIDTEGTFSVAKQSIKKAGFYYLDFADASRINLFLKPSDYINLNADASQLTNSIKSNNSKFHTTLWKLNKNRIAFAKEMDQLSDRLNQIDSENYNDSIYKALYKQKEILIEQYRKQSIDITKGNESPILEYIMLNQKAGNISIFNLQKDIQLFIDNAEKLTSNPETAELFQAYDQQIMQAFTAIRAEQRYHQGGTFPELRARTNWNEIVTLNQVKGKPCHIILWSGKDLMDDAKLKQSKQLMYRYGPKGLKTIMVAYTKDKESWLGAIKKYKLPYWHLLDTNSVESLDLVEMGVRSLPCNFVVDSTGVILQRNIWGDQLNQSILSYIKK
ncbi:TlpA family protein disulfide reductase [Labilibacter marinus]|uniref:TlpA family protein disulfide reductase n=1 Tax=Labilibacter marinus TaxID=1477105 RepID=UPI00082DA3C4|nr:redoxin domain-containing protein [Labilibacter marinus]